MGAPRGETGRQGVRLPSRPLRLRRSRFVEVLTHSQLAPGRYEVEPIEPTALGAAPGDVYVRVHGYPDDTRVALVQVGEWRHAR